MSLHSTEVRLGDGELALQMTRMREWLDSRRFEPAVFRYQHVDGIVVVHVDFTVEEEATAFAHEFHGKILR